VKVRGPAALLLPFPASPPSQGRASAKGRESAAAR